MNRSSPRAIVAIAALLSTSYACAPDPHAYAGRVTTAGQLVGGPRSIGEIGDWRLSNGKVRFVVQDLNMIPAGAKPVYVGTADAGVGGDRNYATFGGTLIDADLARPEAEMDPRATGDGADGLGEMFPSFFLSALEPDSIQVIDDGSTGNAARIRVIGRPAEFLTQTELVDCVAVLGGFPGPSGSVCVGAFDIRFTVDYALGPNDDYLSITAAMTNNDSRDRKFSKNLFGIPSPIGFIGLFGEDQPLFLPGEAGFDVRFGLARSYSRKYSLPAISGVTTDVIAVDSARISYGISYCPTCETVLEGAIPSSAGFVSGSSAQYAKNGPVNDNTMLVPFVSGSLLGIFAGAPPETLPSGQSYGVTVKLRVGPPTPSFQIDAVLEEQGAHLGQFAGRVREEESLALLQNASVVVYSDASAEEIGAGVAQGCAAGPDHLGCMVTDAKTDVGGRFHAMLPPGKYRAVVRDVPHPDSAPIPITITYQQQTYQELYSPRYGTLVVEVTDENNRLSPAKVTLSNSYPEAKANQDPQTFLYDYRLGDPYRPTDLIPDTSDPETRRYIEDTFYTQNGRAECHVRPGSYRATISRGPSYPIVEQEVSITAGQSSKLGVNLPRALPAHGWVQADFHVHAAHSVDSSTPYPKRALSLAGEGLDFIAMTEHNFIGDIRPTIVQTGLYDFLQATSGIEESSLEAGHWNAYPLQYDQSLSTHGALPWFRRSPADLYANLHAIGRWSPEATMVEVNHPRDSVQGNFTAYGVTGFPFTGDPEHDWPGKGCYQKTPTDAGVVCNGRLVPNGPGFDKGEFTLDNLQAMEVLNSKRYDLLSTYRVPAVLPDLPVCGSADAGTRCIPPTCANAPTAKPCIGKPGELVYDQYGQVAFPGAFEDWEHIHDSGRRIVGVGNSDTHEQYDEPGNPRNMIYIGHEWSSASQLDEQEIIAALIAGKSVETNGPQIELTVIDANHTDGGVPIEVPIGGMVQPDNLTGSLTVHVIVRAAPWVQVDSVQYLLGQVTDQHGAEYERYLDPRAVDVPCDNFHPCLSTSGTSAVRLDQTFVIPSQALNAATDYWIAVRATGTKTLWPVITQYEIPPLLLNDAVSQLTSAIPIPGLASPLGALGPSVVSLVTPYALANPVFIDGNRDGVWGRQGSQTGIGRVTHSSPGHATAPRQADSEGDLARLQAALGAALQRSHK